MNLNLPSDSKVLVTGATGFTGRALIDKLIAQGLDVRVIARPSKRADELSELSCTVYSGQVYDPEIIATAVKGVNYIFHVAAAFREAGIGDEIYTKVHLDSTKLLAEEAIKQSDFRRFIHVSTMGVHGHISNPPGDEESPYSPGDLYQDTKLKAELWIRDFAKQKKLPLVVIRPTAIYGPGDKRLLKIFKMSTWPIFPILGFGKCWYHLIHVDDLTNSFLLAAIHNDAVGNYFLCGDEQAITLVDMVKIAGKVTGKNPFILRIPVTPFFWIADLCELICRPLGVEPPIYRRRVAFYTKDRNFDTSKIRNKLGMQNKYSNESGIQETVKWYLEQGWL